jgi:hypothetical protein
LKVAIKKATAKKVAELPVWWWLEMKQ